MRTEFVARSRTPSTLPVDSFKANAWGLYNVHGNVSEWTEDCWSEMYLGAPTDGSAWALGHCTYRVVSGGSWLGSPSGLRSANRSYLDADGRVSGVGFRLARNP